MRPQSAERRLIETMGHMLETDGLARITGQMLALLVLADEPLSGSRIAELLQVSRASVSTNVRLLEALGIAERRSQAGQRQISYALRPDAYANYMRQTALRQRDNAERIAAIAEAMDDPSARMQVEALGKFFSSAAKGAEQAADELADSRAGRC